MRESQGQDKHWEEGVGGFGKDYFSQKHVVMLYKGANGQEFGISEKFRRGVVRA